ncbi:MAG: hypothetical protein EKK69_02525 [Candidatus Competibacteraceae bacterium]|nr:MAG: hypothetical protein EKK69_02525 [Candidatus Competibacteraceae bacterium]
MNSAVEAEASTFTLPPPTLWWRALDWMFVGFLAVGASWIVALKSLGIGVPVSDGVASPMNIALSATGPPVLLIIIYMFYAVKAERFKGREYWAADNLYYLGFLYTLTSLSVSIAQFSVDQSNIGIITSNFGIALATTIFGLALRIVMSQLRQDVTEFERQAHQELSRAVQQFRTRLDDSTHSLDGFNRDLMANVRKNTDELAQRTTEMLDTHSQHYIEMLERMSAGLKDAAMALPQMAAMVNGQIGGTVKALQRLNQRIDAIETPSDLLERKLAPAAAALGRLIDQSITHLDAGTARFDRLQAALETALSHYDQLNTLLKQLNQTHGNQVANVLRETEGLRAALIAVQQTSAQTSNELTQNTRQQTELTAEFLKTTRTVIDEHQLALRSELEGMYKRLELINQETDIRYNETVRTLHSLPQVVDKLNATNTAIEALNTQAAQHGELLARLTQTSEMVAHAAETHLERLTQTSTQAVTEHNTALRGELMTMRKRLAAINTEADGRQQALEREMARLGEITRGFDAAQHALERLSTLASQQGETLVRWAQTHEQSSAAAEHVLHALQEEWQRTQITSANLMQASTSSNERLDVIAQTLGDSLRVQRDLITTSQAAIQHCLQHEQPFKESAQPANRFSLWFGRRG